MWSEHPLERARSSPTEQTAPGEEKTPAMSADDEADARNAVLVACHGRIPSYALWRGCDVERETNEARAAWWNDFDGVAVENSNAAHIVRRWARLRSVASSGAGAVIGVEVDEDDAMLHFPQRGNDENKEERA